MRNICCLNQISHYGTDRLTGDYKLVDDIKDAEGILVRSASLHETEFPSGLQAIARAGAGVNNIRLTSVRRLVLSYSIHRAQIRTV